MTHGLDKRNLSRRRWPARAVQVCCGLVVLLLVCSASVAHGRARDGELAMQGSNGDARQLNPNETIKRQMTGGETHLYQMSLLEGQFLRLVVEQQGIDVVAILKAADGSPLVKMDSPNGRLGPEAVSVVAQSSGIVILEVNSERGAPPGEYELRVEGPRASTPADAQRERAERVFAEAQRLRVEAAAESKAAAIEKYKEALALWNTPDDARPRAYSFCGIGRAYRALGKLTEALDNLNQALALLTDLRDLAGQAFIRNEIAAAHRDLDADPLKALAQYNLALELRSSIGDKWGQAQIFNNIGHLYWRIGQQHKAIENFQRALPLWQAVQDGHMESNTLNNLAESYADLGDLSYALDYFEKLLKFCRENGDDALEAYVQNNIGKIYDTWAESQKALASYQAALDIFHRLKNSGGEALVLDNIGIVYAGTGDADRALENFQKSLELRRQLNEPYNLAFTLTHIGYAHVLQGNYGEALKQLNLALPLSREAHHKLFEAYALFSIGMVYAARGEIPKALEYYRQALDIQIEIKDNRSQAITLDKMGQAYALSRQLPQAMDSYEQALQRWAAVGDRQGQALTLYGIAHVERERGNLSAARERIENAINIVESLRAKMPSYQLRMTYFATKQDFYALDIDVKARIYELSRSEADAAAALSASERARARNLLDLLSEARIDIFANSDPQTANRGRQLEEEINALTQSLVRLRDNASKKTETSAAFQNRPSRTDDAAIVQKRLSTLITEYDDLQSKVRAASASYAELRRPQPLGLREIQQLLDDDNTLLLEYALGDSRSYLWAVTKTSIEVHTLPVRDEIEKAVERLRLTLTAHEPPRAGESAIQYLKRVKEARQQFNEQALELSRMLLGPVAPRLGKKRLVIVADGGLQYIPFEALSLPDAAARNGNAVEAVALSPLALEHEIVYQPSASALSLLRAAPRMEHQKTVAVFADPVFDAQDKRLALSGKGKSAGHKEWPGELRQTLRDIGDIDAGEGQLRLERLRYSGDEADAIVASAADGSWVKAVGFDANRGAVLKSDLARFSVVHFATHSILNNRQPELSGIVLSLMNKQGQPDDGFLRLGNIYNLNLPVDLVVLSACRTGIGKWVRGEGLLSLTRGFMHAGAQRVVASLWKVEDEATAELMKRFYRHLLREHMTAAAALRQAKIELMEAREQWRAPYYWAGFVLQGDWR